MNLRLAAVALNQTPLDWPGNEARIRAALNETRAGGASLVCLPELCLTGYGCEDAFFAPATWERAWQMLCDLLPDTRGMIVAFGLPVFHQRALFNVSAVVADGKLLGLAAKKNLAGDGIHYEPRWFKPWPGGVQDEFTALDGTRIPIGDLVFETGGVKLGFEICEDAWVADRPGARLAARGVDVILNPSASHFAFGKAGIRRRFVAEGSRAFGAAYVYSNLLGNEAGRVIYDGQLLIAEGGNVIAESARFGFTDHRVLAATVDITAGRLAMARSASHRPALPVASDPGLVTTDFAWPEVAVAIHHHLLAGPEEKTVEFTRAVTLGLFDYLRKSRSSGYVVSLSGGADSAAVVCLIRLMFELAREELGDDLGGKLATTDFGELLLTAYQATEHSGDVTREAARLLAAEIGATHRELDVSALHRGYVAMIEQAYGTPLNWTDHDIPLQNIQARVRSPGIWMLANLRNALLLSTSNRSEAAVGYATMDGDTSGGLAPVSGIDKAFLREWLRWLETAGPVIGGERRPIPALSTVNVQQPTAELRPGEQGQTDEGDLMPYPVLDFIERSAIRDRKSPRELLDLLEIAFPGHPEGTRRQWTRRFFTLWSRNQWKRERYAPGFHLDDENLDPKTWCRWPILSGGFQEELEAL
ncbi:NAD(+) synthase [Luteolibacter flavescens]|uniref:Glutamine-dependent NAD(+) synthetase n=1 Tax=Luteolibacter flavescens TaxID=1859460 RepID=A0ABT3FU39_9BACT|nr:NAD(+) synthase [Luteolibacter flavescens]MCW1887101.1 NAD(+) synthase [Luteolibacter flavescens]